MEIYPETASEQCRLIAFGAMRNPGEINLKSCVCWIEPLFADYANETPQDGTPPAAFTSVVLRRAFGDWIRRPHLGDERG